MTTRSTSVAQHVLSLPELLHLIFLDLEDEKPTLAACMRVNKTWMSEAIRVLWASCGDDFRDPKYLPLRVKDLVALRKKPERLQWYASFIQSLEATQRSKYAKTAAGWKKKMNWGGPRYHDSHLLSRLEGIRFPRLKSLIFGPTYGGPNINYPRLIVQYLGPALEYLNIDAPYFSHDFFDTLTAQCTSLRKLNLDCDDNALQPCSEEAFETFLMKSPTLRELRLHNNFQPWTKKIFHAVALHPSLQKFYPPDISESWGLPEPSNPTGDRTTSKLFPSLEDFVAEISEKLFEDLAPAICTVPELTLTFKGPCHGAGNIATILSGLRELTFDGGWSRGFTIHAEDLLAISRNSPSLVEFTCLASDHLDNPPVKAIGFSDAIMAEIAECLPHLERFVIEADHDNVLTEKTVLSFGRRCKSVKRIKIRAKISFEGFVDDGEDGMFPKLEALNLSPPSSYGQFYCRDAFRVVERLRTMCPLLVHLTTPAYDPEYAELKLASLWEAFLSEELQERKRHPPRL